MSILEKISKVNEVNQLLLQGKQRGYLTYEEVNDILPSNVVAPEQIDDLMHLFEKTIFILLILPLKEKKLFLMKMMIQKVKTER